MGGHQPMQAQAQSAEPQSVGSSGPNEIFIFRYQISFVEWKVAAHAWDWWFPNEPYLLHDLLATMHGFYRFFKNKPQTTKYTFLFVSQEERTSRTM